MAVTMAASLSLCMSILQQSQRAHKPVYSTLTPGTGDLPLAEEVLCGPAPFTAGDVVPASNVYTGDAVFCQHHQVAAAASDFRQQQGPASTSKPRREHPVSC